MATIVEEKFDEAKNKMVWPSELSPFQIMIISLGQNDEAEKLYNDLIKTGADILYDDRDLSAGEKFGDADLIGIGYKIIVSAMSLAGAGFEWVDEYEGTTEVIEKKDIFLKVELMLSK